MSDTAFTELFAWMEGLEDEAWQIAFYPMTALLAGQALNSNAAIREWLEAQDQIDPATKARATYARSLVFVKATNTRLSGFFDGSSFDRMAATIPEKLASGDVLEGLPREMIPAEQLEFITQYFKENMQKQLDNLDRNRQLFAGYGQGWHDLVARHFTPEIMRARCYAACAA